MARKREFLIAAGLREDCDALVSDFLALNTVRFGDFARLWAERGFCRVYDGRPTLWELAEFAEEALAIAGEFLFFESGDVDGAEGTEAFRRRVAGLYLAYALRRACPLPDEMSPRLRVPPAEARAIVRLRRSLPQDALYALCSMLHDGVFAFVAEPSERALEARAARAPAGRPGPDGADGAPERDPGGRRLAALLADGELGRLRGAVDDYARLKARLPGGRARRPPRELDYLDGGFPARLEDSLESLRRGRRPEKTEPSPPGPERTFETLATEPGAGPSDPGRVKRPPKGRPFSVSYLSLMESAAGSGEESDEIGKDPHLSMMDL